MCFPAESSSERFTHCTNVWNLAQVPIRRAAPTVGLMEMTMHRSSGSWQATKVLSSCWQAGKHNVQTNPLTIHDFPASAPWGTDAGRPAGVPDAVLGIPAKPADRQAPSRELGSGTGEHVHGLAGEHAGTVAVDHAVLACAWAHAQVLYIFTRNRPAEWLSFL
jgi:hypothetical protein